MIRSDGLDGRGLRALWVAIFVLQAVVFVSGLAVWFPRLQEPCRDTPQLCQSQLRYSAADAERLQRYGWSPASYAWYSLVTRAAGKLLSAGLGLLIFWRRPLSAMTLVASLFLVVGLEGSVGQALAQVQPAWWLPTRGLEFVGSMAFVLFFYLFPTGHLAPAWARWPLAAWGLVNFFATFFPSTVLSINTAPPVVAGAITMPLFGTLLVAQVYRYRRLSSPSERLQTKWVVFATVIGVAAFLGAVFSVLPAQDTGIRFASPYWVLTDLGFMLIGYLLPLGIALAILRYRLWDIDVIIRRTLIYSTLSAVLAAAYFGSVLVLESLLRALTGQGQNALVVVLSTLAIAALFGPVRRRVQAVIDRRFFRQKYDAARTLAGFAASARDEVELERLSERLVRVVDETMQPAGVGLWLKKTPTAKLGGDGSTVGRP
jgi:hypothetical protein